MPGDYTCPSCGGVASASDPSCPSCGAVRSAAATVLSQGSLERITAERLTNATSGEFEILERLGYGAMGSVYLARDIALSRRVAIKVISPHLLEDEAVISRFRLEAQTVAALRHPNVVNVYGVRQLGDLHYFIMDFIDGPSLRSLMKVHAPLEIPVVQALLFQIGGALSYAHRRGRGVIHRDIKPANIMVDREGHAIVMDFGISRVGGDRSGLTQTGSTHGTPEYMSPEQCMDEELTGASDQYAFGIVAYEMLTGAVPFSGSTYAMMMSHASSPPPPIRDQRPDCPTEVEAAVMRMLAKAPAERYSDMDAAVRALKGRPLSPGDPIRDQIISLAESVSSGLEALDDSSPLSPVAGSPEQGTIAIIGLPDVVEPGDRFDLHVESGEGTGSTRQLGEVVWSTSNPTVASVEDGTVLARMPGSVSLTAMVGPVASTVILSVRERRSAAVSVRPRTVLIEPGGTVPLEADALDREGHPVATPLVWKTEDPSVALVAQDGRLTAVGPGSTRVVADADGATAIVEIEVRQAPTQEIFSGQAPQTTRQAEVSGSATVQPSGTPTAATQTGATSAAEAPSQPKRKWPLWIGAAAVIVVGVGLAQMMGSDSPLQVEGEEGSTPVQAGDPPPQAGDPSPQAGDRSRQAVDSSPQILDSPTQAVDERAVASLRIEGGDQVLEEGERQPLTTTALNANGLRVDTPTLRWRSSDPAVAVVRDGNLRATGPGSATITASVRGIESSIEVTVEAPAPELPTREEAAAQVQRFVNLLQTGDTESVARLLGRAGGKGAGGEDFVARMREAGFTPRLLQVGQPVATPNGAAVGFEMEFSWRNPRGSRNQRRVGFLAVLRPTAEGWRLAGVTPRPGADRPRGGRY